MIFISNRERDGLLIGKKLPKQPRTFELADNIGTSLKAENERDR